MSYSRWLSSYWYTFWHVAPEDVVEDRDNALFCICTLMDGNITFSAKDLRENQRKCLETVSKIETRASMADIKELRSYMDTFLEDVDRKYQVVTD